MSDKERTAFYKGSGVVRTLVPEGDTCLARVTSINQSHVEKSKENAKRKTFSFREG